MNRFDSALLTDGFCQFLSVAGRHSIADVFPQNKRCGIYILRFSDGMYYIGQAVDVARRFTQHQKNHSDIEAIAFKQIPKSHLNEEESYFIGKMEPHCRLRNISLASLPHILESELDDLLPPEQQAIWLQSNDSIHGAFSRVEDPALRDRTARRCQRLLSDNAFNSLALPVMQEYVRTCIPEPYLTELTFWGCSCLPPYRNKNLIIYSRVNLRFQEVFTAGFDKQGKFPFFNWHVCKSLIFGPPLERLCRQVRTLYTSDHIYQTGGSDQIDIGVDSKEDALALLKNESFLLAAKTFNLRCMRKGAQPYANTHCPSLADLFLPA